MGAEGRPISIDIKRYHTKHYYCLLLLRRMRCALPLSPPPLPLSNPSTNPLQPTLNFFSLIVNFHMPTSRKLASHPKANTPKLLPPPLPPISPLPTHHLVMEFMERATDRRFQYRRKVPFQAGAREVCRGEGGAGAQGGGRPNFYFFPALPRKKCLPLLPPLLPRSVRSKRSSSRVPSAPSAWEGGALASQRPTSSSSSPSCPPQPIRRPVLAA